MLSLFIGKQDYTSTFLLFLSKSINTMAAQPRTGVSLMDTSEYSKEKLLADLKAGAVNIIALRPLRAGEQEAFDQVMGKLRQGASWLGLVTNDKVAVFYERPLAQRMANLTELVNKGDGYSLLHIEKLDIMAGVLKAAETLLQERQILLLFDYDGYPGGARMVSFFIVPMEGFEAHDPGFEKVIKKVKEGGETSG